MSTLAAYVDRAAGELEVISRLPAAGGHATPVVFVHGGWHGAWCWDEYFLSYFAAHGYPAYALSLRGHGRSAGRDRLRWNRIADYVADVAHVAGSLPRQPVLVGHSMGGFVVQKYLETRSAAGGVLMASVPPQGVWSMTCKLARRYPLAFVRAQLTLSLYGAVANAARVRDAFFSRSLPEDRLHTYTARMQEESYRGFLDMLCLDLPRAKPLQIPLLVLGAERDTLLEPREVEATARAYNARAEIFPDLAHDMMLDERWEVVAARIVEWLKQQRF